MTTYLFNGVDPITCYPQTQKWIDIVIGYDHTGRPILASTRHVELSFDQTSVSNYRKYSVLHGTSMTAVTLINLDAGSYTTYSNAGINFQIKERPAFQAGNVSGFVCLITGIIV